MTSSKRPPMRLAPLILGLLCCAVVMVVMVAPRRSAIPTNNSAAPATDAPPAAATPRPATSGAWRPLSGNIYAGVKMYYGQGEDKTLAFTVLGGNEGCDNIPSGRGLYVEYPDGGREWKDRAAMIESPYNFIRADDPALKTTEWYTFPCP